MYPDYLKKNKRAIPPVLLFISGILAVLTMAKVVGLHFASSNAESIVVKAVSRDRSDSAFVKESTAGFHKITDALKKESLFVPIPPKRNPVSIVAGILGDEALINNKWYKAGDSIGGAKIIVIEPTHVIIEWEGKETTYAPITAITAPVARVVSEVAGSAVPVEVKGPEKAVSAQRPKASDAEEFVSGDDDPLSWIGMDLPPRIKAMVMEKWNQLSAEEKERHKAQWLSMSAEQRQQMVSMIEAQMGG